MRLPPDLEARVLRMTGVDPPPAKRRREAAPELVAAGFTPPGTWVVPVATASEANGRDWRARSRRSDAAWRAVSRAFGPHLLHAAAVAAAYHRGEPVRVRLVRLGGSRLDPSNLPTALKATEDAVAYLLGADDGDPRWRAEWGQEPGGRMGVRVELSVGG